MNIVTLDIDEFCAEVKANGFYVSEKHKEIGFIRLGLDKRVSASQSFVKLCYNAQKISAVYLAFFLLSLFDKDSDRYLFIENSLSYYTLEQIFLKARDNYDNKRDLMEAPVLKFTYTDWRIKDLTALPIEDQNFVMLCANFVALVLISQWDACLLSSSTSDYFFLSEGSIYLYSTNSEMLKEFKSYLEDKQ